MLSVITHGTYASWNFSDTIADVPNDPPDLRINGHSPNGDPPTWTGSELDIEYGVPLNVGNAWSTSAYTLGDINFDSGQDITTPQTGVVT